MKKLIFTFMALLAFHSYSGVIESRNSSDSLQFEIDQDTEEVVIKGIISGSEVNSRIPLLRHSQSMAEAEVTIHEVGFFGLPFGRVQDGIRILNEEQLKNPLLIASLFTLTLTMDVIGLPFDLIDEGFKNMAINKDVRILKKALDREYYSKNVSQKRFDRIVGYLELL